MQRNGRVAHFSQAESHSREEGDAIWICGVCTLENPLKHLQCGACTAERPEVYGDIEKELDDTGNDDDANGRTDTAEEAAGPEEEVSREGVKSKWTKQKDWYDNVEELNQLTEKHKNGGYGSCGIGNCSLTSFRVDTVY
ncbi:hypothetical protein BESB_077320 [Besnoitia besnoiti]|uniref:RanBP2-type domain-containing protein n=1 Tax=Besnoitia besnoiti TaxID=94643 RepID=A0A2A9M6B5_BESBE|nr:hypothetical protein BESB_077320 [Besnoitia besnoiti]PFH33515.1 hypothetical protein BESB_077320 [Besnoitia besnoiti]